MTEIAIIIIILSALILITYFIHQRRNDQYMQSIANLKFTPGDWVYLEFMDKHGLSGIGMISQTALTDPTLRKDHQYYTVLTNCPIGHRDDLLPIFINYEPISYDQYREKQPGRWSDVRGGLEYASRKDKEYMNRLKRLIYPLQLEVGKSYIDGKGEYVTIMEQLEFSSGDTTSLNKTPFVGKYTNGKRGYFSPSGWTLIENIYSVYDLIEEIK